MKKDIHPKYNGQVTAKCECGATFAVGSTKDGITTEICSNCHPFYTGKQKLVDTAGRVEKFEAKRKKAEAEAKKNTKKDNDEAEEEAPEAEEEAPEDEEEAPEAKEEAPEAEEEAPEAEEEAPEAK